MLQRDERYCLCIPQSATVQQLKKTIEDRLRNVAPFDLKLRLLDGEDYEMFPNDPVNEIMTKDDIIIVDSIVNNPILGISPAIQQKNPIGPPLLPLNPIQQPSQNVLR